MPSPRRTLCALLAAGRITPAEAERLLAAWSLELDLLWVLAAACLLPLVTGLLPLVAATHGPHLAAHVWSSLRHALPLFHNLQGGLS